MPMDELKLMEILTKLEAQQTRLFDNVKEVKEDVKEVKVDVKEMTQIVPKIDTRLAIIEDKKLDERITNIEKWIWKAMGALVIIQMFFTVAVTIIVKVLFN